MAPLGPFAGDRRIAAAVSGGADSMALALLLREWGRPTALVVDHGLRAEAAGEAELTLRRLDALRIPARLLRASLRHGPGLAERARAERYRLLDEACRALGLADLALGHHQRDQAETLLLRQAGGSGPAGLSGMAGAAHTDAVRRLRPLLRVDPGRLRATLNVAAVEWVEDPSNRDPATPRARLRAQPAVDGRDAATLGALAARYGVMRAAGERDVAAELAAEVDVRPDGTAHMRRAVRPATLSHLVWSLSGAAHPPAPAAVARLADAMRSCFGSSATLHGVRLLPAGSGRGWLLGREAAAMAEPVPVAQRWDGRFQAAATACGSKPADGTTLGALGDDAARLRRWSMLPAALLRTLPTLRRDGAIVAVPHLLYPDAAACRAAPVLFCPGRPAGPAAFAAS